MTFASESGEERVDSAFGQAEPVVFGEELHELIAVRFPQPLDGGQDAELGQSLAKLSVPLIDVQARHVANLQTQSTNGRYLGLHSSGVWRSGQARLRVIVVAALCGCRSANLTDGCTRLALRSVRMKRV